MTLRGKQVLETAMRQLYLTACAIADRIDAPHVAQALQYQRRRED